LYSKLQLLLSTEQYGTWDQFLGFSKYFKFLIDISRYFGSLVDVSGYLVLVEFSRIVKSVKSNRFLRCGVDINGNLKLSKFLKF
jgi:hypothetical protein